MSELRIVTPDECIISDEIKRELVADVNRVLLSGGRIYTVARSRFGFLKEVAAESGWSVQANVYEGNFVVAVFSQQPE